MRRAGKEIVENVLLLSSTPIRSSTFSKITCISHCLYDLSRLDCCIGDGANVASITREGFPAAGPSYQRLSFASIAGRSLTLVHGFPNVADDAIHDPPELLRILLFRYFIRIRGVDEYFGERRCSCYQMWGLQLSLDHEGSLILQERSMSTLRLRDASRSAPLVQSQSAVAYRSRAVTVPAATGLQRPTHLAPLLGTAAGPGSLGFSFKCGKESGFFDELGSPAEGTSRKGIARYL